MSVGILSTVFICSGTRLYIQRGQKWGQREVKFKSFIMTLCQLVTGSFATSGTTKSVAQRRVVTGNLNN
jgi:hypothetical protein